MLKFDMEDLTGTDFGGVALSGIIFTCCEMSSVKVVGSDFSGGSIYDCELSGAELRETNLDGLTLKASAGDSLKVESCSMMDTSLWSCTFSDLRLKSCKLGRANIMGNDLIGGVVEDCHITSCTLEENALSSEEAPLKILRGEMRGSSFLNNGLDHALVDGTSLKDVAISESDFSGSAFLAVEATGLVLKGKNVFSENSFIKTTILSSQIDEKIVTLNLPRISRSHWEFSKSGTVQFQSAEINHSSLEFVGGDLHFQHLYSEKMVLKTRHLDMRLSSRVYTPTFSVVTADFRNSTLTEPIFLFPSAVKKLSFVDCHIIKADFRKFKKHQLEFVNTDTSSCLF